jgi:hypothetical protein
MRSKAILAVFALSACLVSGLVTAGADGAVGTGNPSAAFLASGSPVQFRNPPFTNVGDDAATPWLVGWDPNRASPDQLPPIQGRVGAMTRVGDYVYLAGMFHRALAPDGTYDESVRHLVRVRWDTGQLDTAWRPQLRGPDAFGDGSPWNFASFDPGDGITRLVVVGDFTQIDGNTANARYLAVFQLHDPAPPKLDTVMASATNVAFGDKIHAVGYEFDGTDHVLYVGGWFNWVTTAAGDQPRKHLAKLRLTGGRFVLDDRWTPSIQSSDSNTLTQTGIAYYKWVARILPVPRSNRVIVGGHWTVINKRGKDKEKYLAALDKDVGAVQPWADPINTTSAGKLPIDSTKPTSSFPVFDMVLVDEGGVPVLYSAHGGSNLAARWDPLTGKRAWYWWSNGGVQAVTVMAGRVYFGFHGNFVKPDKGGSKKGNLTVRRDGLWVVSPDGSTLYSYAPSFRNAPESRTSEGSQKVWALLGDGNLYVGGDFTNIDYLPVAKFAIFPAQ